jgi:hypothetical protein
MTHTLHRQGTLESLERDYVIFAMPSSGLNSEGSKPKLQKVYEILQRHNPVNIGDSKGGSRFSLGSDEAVRNIIVENELVHGVFRTREQVIDVLKDLKEEDLGLSVTVSGLIHNVQECCNQVGLKPHTIVKSLGIWGKTDLLPDSKIQEIATMCGHGLVSFSLIKELADQVKRGQLSTKKAGEMLAKPCICGVFNPERAAELIEELNR